MLLAWAAMTTEAGYKKAGALGKVAVDIAWFPTVAEETLSELADYLTGEYEDKDIAVARDASLDQVGFEALASRPGIEVPGLIVRADPDRMAKGWRLIAGSFHLNGQVENAALLVSPELRIVRSWVLDEQPIGDWDPAPKHKKFVHGLEILPDASLVFTFDGSMSLQRFDRCGARLWGTAGAFHHSVTLDDQAETVWTFNDMARIAQVAVADGRVLKTIDTQEIIDANPAIDILEIHRKHDNDQGQNSRNTEGMWEVDALHYNDVDPLPRALAQRFPDFEAGDLLISARALNLVFVLDPDSLEIKWWRIGAVQRQHDPDWMANGEIQILNNRMSRDYSEIVSIDPKSFDTKVVFDGRGENFYTRIRGKQQTLEQGHLVITSPQQGRAFEVDRTGKPVFEVINRIPGDPSKNYVISEMRWLPPDYFEKDFRPCASPPASS